MQWNLLIADILYSGHLSTTVTFLRNVIWPSNFHSKTSMQWTLYIRYLSIADIIFRSQSTLPPRTDSITGHIRHLLFHFICVHFTLDSALHFRLSFLRSFLFYFLASLKLPFQVHKNENSKGILVRIHLHGWRTFQLQKCPKRNGVEIETRIQLWRFLLHMANHFFTMRISTNHSYNILVHFIGLLFHALQTLPNQWLPNYHINMISYNILS